MATLKQLAKRIRKAGDLWDLHQALCDFENAINGDAMGTMYELNTEGALNAEGIDLCELPTFGGPDPESTAEVWSWDADHILTGVGSFRDWEIRSRD